MFRVRIPVGSPLLRVFLLPSFLPSFLHSFLIVVVVALVVATGWLMQVEITIEVIILQLPFVVVVVKAYRGPIRGVRAWVLVQVTRGSGFLLSCVLTQSAFGFATRLAVPCLLLMLK